MIRAIVVACLLASPLTGGEARQDLAGTIEALGTNESAKRRNALAVDGCTITTFVWKPWQHHDKVLYSSFTFELANLQPPKAGAPIGHSFKEGETETGHAAIHYMRMEEGSNARHELPMFRKPKAPFLPSDREGVDNYVFKQKKSFVIVHEDIDPGHALIFHETLYRYRREYCLPTG